MERRQPVTALNGSHNALCVATNDGRLVGISHADIVHLISIRWHHVWGEQQFGGMLCGTKLASTVGASLITC